MLLLSAGISFCINEAVFVRYSSIVEGDTVSSKSQSDMIDKLALK